MPKAFASHHDWYLAIIDSLEITSVTNSDALKSMPTLIYSYDNAIHGFSVVLSLEELQKLQNYPGFVSAYPDKIIKLHTTHTMEFLSLNNVSGLWPASNYGKGVIIGLMDSGVRPESKSYNDDGMEEIPKRWKGFCQDAGDDFNSSMCNRKLIGARAFYRSAKAAKLRGESDDDSPRDTYGHGTHTSTTAAGNYVKDVSFFGYAKGTARGVAPRAHVAMYSVSGTTGAGSDLLAGMDQAIEDGVDVISISMGVGWIPLYEDPIAIAGFAAMEKGVFVSASAGNSGPRQVENSIPWLLTVAASTIDRQNSANLIFGNGMSTIGWSRFPANALLENVPLVYNETFLACNSSELLLEVSGKIVVCSEDYGWIGDQIQTLSDSAVAGAIIISSNTEYIETKDISCPGVVITPVQATQLINYVTSTANPTATLRFQQDVLGAKPAPAVAWYSSRGPSRTLPSILKPDLMAPGSQVLAAWVPSTPSAFIGSNIVLSSDYTLSSGTSMSCPHAAGVAALLKAAHPEWSPAAIKSAMMTTASLVGNDNSPIRDNRANLTFATPLDMGAGQIDPNKALDPGLIYELSAQDYVNHLCLLNFTMKQILTITRSSKYDCSNPSDLNYPSFMAYFKKTTSTTHEFHRTVTNIGNDLATYKAYVRVPRGTSITVTPETLVFSEKYGKVSFNVSVDIKQMKKKVAHGSLVWEQVGGNHTVTSPIVVVRKF
ncbi:Subtilisin-like protease SBT1.9 [Thalictrum thalictroides]|uniref:Subtilisin-like protease SBT1.9 n=1 Tax=Thalictrum thalictroides TaxID=46969 RepID=A0A7J6X7F2_THATH|nr:Subtilisin-like protease SBT1.9 [Thalictrum thalictroides]